MLRRAGTKEKRNFRTVRNLSGYPNDHSFVSAARSQGPPSGTGRPFTVSACRRLPPIGHRPASMLLRESSLLIVDRGRPSSSAIARSAVMPAAVTSRIAW
jgi:hypothetical protein